MKYTYEEIVNIYGTKSVLRSLDGEPDAFIPIEPANSDYQSYLRWLENPDAEEGGTL